MTEPHDWTPTHPYLVVVRAGPRSLHRNWLAPSQRRGFDLLVSAYDSTIEDSGLPGVFLEQRAGSKVASYARLFEEKRAFLENYRFIALFDDDLSIDAAALTACFEVASRHGLKICQPSLSHDSHFTYAALLQNKSYALRYVNYVEMMCPIFRTDVLMKIRPLYALGYESGIDLIWCNTGQPGPKDFAVIDAVSVRHTRPVGGQKSENGFTNQRRYEDDIYDVLDRYALPWLSCVPYSAVDENLRETTSRTRLLLSSLKLCGAIFRQDNHCDRARSVAVHWKHLIRRRPRNLVVDLDRPSRNEGSTG